MIGFIGSFHCVGMCGPIAIALPLKNQNWFSKIVSGLVYNSGRIITYGLMGLIFGLMGRGLQLAGFQRWTSIILGALLIITAVYPLIFKQKIQIESLFTGYTYRLIGRLKKLFSTRSFFSLFSIGLLNGLLPCGLVYVALTGAINTNSVLKGILYMVEFGVGTVGLMLAVSLSGSVVSINFRNKIRKAVPYFVVILGLMFILRGMSLGIPYLSPKAEKLIPKELVIKGESCCK